MTKFAYCLFSVCFLCSACTSDSPSSQGEAQEQPIENSSSQSDDAKCGGFAGLLCEDDSYCEFVDNSCGVGDFFGMCVERPPVCTDIWQPVCGCDGVTYSNECDAQANGYDVAFDGACEQEPPLCGGFAGLECDDNSYCEFEEPNCQLADQLGVCQPKPFACIEIWDPVCDCEGITHSNDCHAKMSGAWGWTPGECPSAY